MVSIPNTFVRLPWPRSRSLTLSKHRQTIIQNENESSEMRGEGRAVADTWRRNIGGRYRYLPTGYHMTMQQHLFSALVIFKGNRTHSRCCSAKREWFGWWTRTVSNTRIRIRFDCATQRINNKVFTSRCRKFGYLIHKPVRVRLCIVTQFVCFFIYVY